MQANLSISDNDKIDFTTKLQIGTIPVRRSRQNGPPPLALQEEVFGASIEYADRDEMVVPDHSPHINGTAPPNLLDFLAVPPTSSRRASAPLWMETVEIGEPVAGPSSAPPRRHLGGRETRELHIHMQICAKAFLSTVAKHKVLFVLNNYSSSLLLRCPIF